MLRKAGAIKVTRTAIVTDYPPIFIGLIRIIIIYDIAGCMALSLGLALRYRLICGVYGFLMYFFFAVWGKSEQDSIEKAKVLVGKLEK